MSDHKINPFARGGLTVPAVIRDAYSRILSVGDMILVHTGRLDPFRVEAITPVVDPRAPQNLLDVTLHCTLKFRCARDVVNLEFTRILEASETRQGKPTTDQSDEPPAV